MTTKTTTTMTKRLLSLQTLFVLLFGSFLVVDVATGQKGRGVERSITVQNDSNSVILVYWVHPTTGAETLMGTEAVYPGTDYVLNSFVGHKFVAREKPSGKDGTTCPKAEDGICRSEFFIVSENDDQVFHLNSDFQIVFTDNKIKAEQEATTIIKNCKKAALARLTKAEESGNEDAATNAMDDLVKCVEGRVTNALERVHEEIAFQSNVRRDIAAVLENYTCLDDTMSTTPSVDSEIWISPSDNVARQVHIKHSRPASRIHVIENFIHQDECQAMEESAEQKLHRATVADGKGGSQYSENRKAMQAGIIVPWDQEASGNPIARLSRRVYDYTNHVLGLDIKEHGQEDLMSIQYNGRGAGDKSPDQYTPHCDGDCTGLKHKYGTRMATMVMYCTVADKGGHTNFRNAGVHVKPKTGDAIFFSYIDPKTMLMDTGFTEHSGCPVFEGSKKIVTQWIRYGVDSENPWDSFNTLGVKNSEIEKHLDFDEDVETMHVPDHNEPALYPGKEEASEPDIQME